MEETNAEFEQEIKTALKYCLEIEQHADDMDPDDVKYLCEKIKMCLERMLNGMQSGKIGAEKF